ncbi:MAG: glutamate racemase [Ruminococcaceae bacterium]|nr:glutamate racemase [Oscillospiraceae bacterium]
MEAKRSPNAPIAVLDSGVGGIGVLREVKRQLPHEHLLYFGDSANAPYGERSRRELITLIDAHAKRLLSKCKALVLACNTATAVAADRLRARYPTTPIIGMEPALKPALAVTPHPRVLVLATETTLREEKFRALSVRFSTATVLPVPAPGLVRLVEAGLADSAESETYLRQLLAPFADPAPDAAVLGCTHFPFAKGAIRRVLGDAIPLFDGAAGTAGELARRLSAAGLLRPVASPGTVTLTSSDQAALPLYRRLWTQPRNTT